MNERKNGSLLAKYKSTEDIKVIHFKLMAKLRLRSSVSFECVIFKIRQNSG